MVKNDAQNAAADLHWLLGAHNSHITIVSLNVTLFPGPIMLVVTYKALHGLGPGYLKDSICPYEPSRTLRPAEEALLPIPLPLQEHLMGTRERTFSVAAPS